MTQLFTVQDHEAMWQAHLEEIKLQQLTKRIADEVMKRLENKECISRQQALLVEPYLESYNPGAFVGPRPNYR